jgi:hypothetical protein
MAEAKRMTEQDYQSWLDTLPEHVPPPTGKMARVIFFGADENS